MFIVGGKRIQMYNNDYMRKNLETFNEEICPLHVDFNYYYKVFYVLTKIDIRLYDAFTGKLLKVYTELHDELAPNSELTAYAIGDKERKFYIADNAGMVRMYNCNNGEIIHKIISMTNLKDWNKMSHSKNCKENYRSKNYEISKMLYLEEEKLLITGSCDSVIRIFEADQEMDPHLLRELKDGHKGSEISALCYSSSFMRLASGSTNGIVSVWDFENNKAESLFQDHNTDITTLHFCYPFPVFLSGCSGGVIACYTLKVDTASYFKPSCLFKMNVMNLVEFHKNPDLNQPKSAGINAMLFYYTDENYIDLSSKVREETKQLLFKDRLDKMWDTPMENWFKANFKDYEYSRQTHEYDSKQLLGWTKEYDKELKSENIDYSGKTQKERENIQNAFNEEIEKGNSSKEIEFISKKNIPGNLKDRIIIEQFSYLHYPEKVKQEAEREKAELMKKKTFSFLEDSESCILRENKLKNEKNKKTNYFYPIEERIAEKKFRSYLVLGDVNGFVRYACLDRIFKELGINKCNTDKFNEKRCLDFKISLRRKDNVSLDRNLDSTKISTTDITKKIPAHFWWNLIELCSMQAHRGNVNKLLKIKGMEGFVSTSSDKSIQLFNLNGSHWGRLNLFKFNDTFWNFPYNWVSLKVKELNHVFDLMEKLDAQVAQSSITNAANKGIENTEFQINEEKRNFLANSFLYKSYIQEYYKLLRQKQISDKLELNEPSEFYKKKIEMLENLRERLAKKDKEMVKKCPPKNLRPYYQNPYEKHKEKSLDELQHELDFYKKGMDPKELQIKVDVNMNAFKEQFRPQSGFSLAQDRKMHDINTKFTTSGKENSENATTTFAFPTTHYNEIKPENFYNKKSSLIGLANLNKKQRQEKISIKDAADTDNKSLMDKVNLQLTNNYLGGFLEPSDLADNEPKKYGVSFGQAIGLPQGRQQSAYPDFRNKDYNKTGVDYEKPSQMLESDIQKPYGTQHYQTSEICGESFASDTMNRDYTYKRRGIAGLIKPAKIIPPDRNFGKKFHWDIRTNPKEFVRSMKGGIDKMIYGYESQSHKIRCVSNYSQQKSKKMHKTINNMNFKTGKKWDDKVEDQGNFDKFAEKIVAKKSFFLDPTQNNPKIIKTSNKLYVI